MKRSGHLVIIGGHEDKQDDKEVLARFVALAGGTKADVVLLTTASREADRDPAVEGEIAAAYDEALRGCGARRVTLLPVHDRAAADDPETAAAIEKASGVFMTGGEQERLVGILGGTAAARAMRAGFRERGLCIGGTSAGASAMSEHMLQGGSSDVVPRKGAMPIAPGLGLVPGVLIDQHFSQRHRLGRLLSVVAQNPFLIGIGIDEDTALVLTPDGCLEVVGSGTVTLVDGREMDGKGYCDVEAGEAMALTDVRLHMLPPGYVVNEDHGSEKLRQALRLIVSSSA